MKRPASWPPVAAALQLLGATGVRTRVGPTFAADLAQIAGVPAAEVAAYLRLGLIAVLDGHIVTWRGRAATGANQ